MAGSSGWRRTRAKCTITLTATIVITTDTTIDGSGHDVTISGNNAVRVYVVNEGATLDLNELTVTNGRANSGSGGGLSNNSGMVTVSNSTFSSNSATNEGGGIYNNGTLTVSNSTFSGNSATYGGGIHSYGTLTVSNSTLSGNGAGNSGGGIFSPDGSATLENTIVANSLTGGNCSGVIINGGGNLSYPDTNCPGINADPVLGPLQNNGGATETMALGEGSAAIDGGNDATCAATPVNNLDQRGVTRPQGLHCDIGAVEQAPYLKTWLPIVHSQ